VVDLSGFEATAFRSVYAVVLKRSDPNPMELQSDDEKIAEKRPTKKRTKNGRGQIES
jgi:hypothetical protein